MKQTTLRVPDHIDELLEKEKENSYTSKNSLIIQAIIEKYLKK